jgi:hypothetical protein
MVARACGRRRAVRFLLGLFAAVQLHLAASGCATSPGLRRLGHTVQVGAFSDVRKAENLASNLGRRGIDAFYFRNERGYFVVRFGDFSTREDAREKAQALVKAGIVDSFFVAPPAAEVTDPAVAGGKLEAAAALRADMGFVAARTAERFVGIPYRWGGNNVVEGLDCSGFTRAVYHLCGVGIPRTSGEQYQAGRQVGREDLRDGDLVFFAMKDGKVSHVGIYIGGGRFVHAPRTGLDIMISGMDEPAFATRYVGARRYL